MRAPAPRRRCASAGSSSVAVHLPRTSSWSRTTSAQLRRPTGTLGPAVIFSRTRFPADALDRSGARDARRPAPAEPDEWRYERHPDGYSLVTPETITDPSRWSPRPSIITAGTTASSFSPRRRWARRSRRRPIRCRRPRTWCQQDRQVLVAEPACGFHVEVDRRDGVEQGRGMPGDPRDDGLGSSPLVESTSLNRRTSVGAHTPLSARARRLSAWCPRFYSLRRRSC